MTLAIRAHPVIFLFILFLDISMSIHLPYMRIKPEIMHKPEEVFALPEISAFSEYQGQ